MLQALLHPIKSWKIFSQNRQEYHPKSIGDHIDVFIQYDEKGRGFRIAAGFQFYNGFFYGFYLGYAGGGCQDDRFFRMNRDGSAIWTAYEGDEVWEDTDIPIANREWDIMFQARGEVSNFFNAGSQEWTTLNPQRKKLLVKAANGQLVYESANFRFTVLEALSRFWGLLTYF